MTKSLAVVASLVLAGFFAPAVQARRNPVAGCARCVAVYNEETGKVNQTCPDGYTSGGLYCIIVAAECRTVGTCSP